MKIIELDIKEFGCLKNKKITLSEGFNIISGDNESGKSTVMLFIKFMLYGLPNKKARGNDRDRSVSFDGKRAAGTMTVLSNGKQYKIERNTVDSGTRLNESLTVTDLSTFETLDGSPGELFLGIPKEVFENSCNVAQMKTAQISKDGAAAVIENMLVSSDESIDVDKVLAEIDKVRKEYKHIRGDGGMLYDIEKEIKELNEKHRVAEQNFLRFNEMNDRYEKEKGKYEKAKTELEDAQKTIKQINIARLVKEFDELSAKRNELSQAKKQVEMSSTDITFGGFTLSDQHIAALRSAAFALSQTQKKIEERNTELNNCASELDGKFPLASVGETLEAEGGKELVLSEINKFEQKAKKSRSQAIALIAVGAIAALVGVIMLIVSFPIPAVAAMIVGVALIAVGAFGFSAHKRARITRDGLCAKYQKSFDEIGAYLTKCANDLAGKRLAENNVISARARLGSAKENLSSAERRVSELLAMTLDKYDVTPSSADREATRLDNLLSTYKQRCQAYHTLQAVVTSKENSLSAYDETELRASLDIDPSQLTPQKIANAERVEKFGQEKVATLDMSINTLRESIAGLRPYLIKSPVELSDEIVALEEKLKKHTEYFDALMLAKETIENARISMSGNVTPEISRKAGEMLATVSGGKHTSLGTTRELAIKVEQDGFNVDSELLSSGTQDTAYLCLRIALMFRLFEGEPAPLILDESLCQLDDNRASVMLRLLGKLSESSLQCLLFTCHKRETAICRASGIEFNAINM